MQNFYHLCLAGVFAAMTFSVATATITPAQAAEPIPDQYKTGGFAIGCQAYSFNRFTAFEAVEKTAAAGGKVIEFYPGQRLSAEMPDVQVGPDMSDEAITQLKAQLDKHGVKAVAFGVTGLGGNEANNRRTFEWCKKMGIGLITSEPDVNALDLIERQVKEFDIKVAIHNHPKRDNDPNYKVWDPNYVLSVVKDRDPRIGACADTGHWVRSGIKPVDALKILEGRVLSSHLKDLHEFSPGGHDMPFGQGVSDIPGILAELERQNFDGHLAIEYEYNWDNSVPEIAQSVGFVRGYGQATP